MLLSTALQHTLFTKKIETDETFWLHHTVGQFNSLALRLNSPCWIGSKIIESDKPKNLHFFLRSTFSCRNPKRHCQMYRRFLQQQLMRIVLIRLLAIYASYDNLFHSYLLQYCTSSQSPKGLERARTIEKYIGLFISWFQK